MVYIIIGRHAYSDARAASDVCIEIFICQCLLYVKVMEKTYNKFHLTMIIIVYNCSVT